MPRKHIPAKTKSKTHETRKPPKPKRPPKRFQPIGRPPGGEEDIGPPLPPGPPPGPPGGEQGGDNYDWLGFGPNIPPEVGATVDKMLRDGKSPGEVFAYLHGTAWFKQEYAGLDQGVANSIFTGGLEALGQYRAYKNRASIAFKAAYGRDMTQAELVNYLSQGYVVERVEGTAAGHAYAEANKGEFQYLTGAFGGGQLTQEELDAYGSQLQGIDTALGQSVKAKVESALQKVNRVFQGTVGSSALGDQALGKALQKKPDIAA